MEINFEKSKKSNFENYYILKCDDENILWTGHKNAPDKEYLRNWYMNQLKRKDRLIFFAKSQKYPKEALGYLYLDFIGENNENIEIGYGVNSKFANKGIGSKTIKFAINYCSRNLPSVNRIFGWVAIENILSVKCFKKNDFSETKESKEIFFEGLNKNVLLKKYVLNLEK